MIGFRDTATLAFTKLRTRKVRLVITIVVSGLLFSMLAGASSVARGAFGSISAFNKEGLGDRYIVQAGFFGNFNMQSNTELIDQVIAAQKDLVARKKAQAKALGVEYDPATEPPAVNEYGPGNGDSKQRMLNSDAPIVRRVVDAYVAAHPPVGLPELKDAAAAYHPTGFFEGRNISYSLNGQRLTVLKDGKESFADNGSKGGPNGPPVGTDSFVQSWTLMSDELLKPFLLPGQDLRSDKDGAMPIIVPYTAAEQLVGMQALPATASSAKRLEHTRKIRKAVESVHFSVCYRNSTSTNLIDKAVQQAAEITRNASKKDYIKPDLVYGTPAEACGAPQVVRDVRSADQRARDAKQQQFDEVFGTPAVRQQKYNFRIVGLVPDPADFRASGVSDMLGSLVTSSLGSGWYSPLSQGLKDATLTELFPSRWSVAASGPTYQVEFSSAKDAHSFIERQSCSPDFSNMTGPGQDPFVGCVAAHKPFSLTPYGSNSLGLVEAKKWFSKFFLIGALVVAGIAAIIMMGTVGRMIADSRRETAVFRAIGAKKLDIAQIYTLYTILLALLISAFAVAMGLIMAVVAHNRWAEGLTVQALVAYNAQDLSRTVDLYSFYLPDMLYLVGLALAGGIFSAIFPLIRNLRRNPIRDMRDDT
jgi:hypothetical protein